LYVKPFGENATPAKSNINARSSDIRKMFVTKIIILHKLIEDTILSNVTSSQFPEKEEKKNFI